MTAKQKSEVRGDTLSFLISPYQHHEWVLWCIAEERSDRAVASARRISGPVDENAVRNRLQTALRRHPVLRLAFDTKEAYAWVMSRVSIPLITRYARPDEDIAAAVARFTHETANAPFAMSSVPAMRATLVRAGFGETQESALLLVAHPIISDETSLDRLLEEIDADEVPEAIDEASLMRTTELSPLGGMRR